MSDCIRCSVLKSAFDDLVREGLQLRVALVEISTYFRSAQDKGETVAKMKEMARAALEGKNDLPK